MCEDYFELTGCPSTFVFSKPQTVSVCSKRRDTQAFGLKEEFEGLDHREQVTKIPGEDMLPLCTQVIFWGRPQMSEPAKLSLLHT